MARSQFLLVMAAAVLSGLIGGASAHWFFFSPAQAQPEAKAVNATELRLVDETGRTRALLSLLLGKPRLIMTDDKGEFRMEMGLDAEGHPNLTLRDQAGRTRAALKLNQGDPVLSFLDTGGRRRVTLKLNASGAPIMIMRDELDLERVALWQEKEELGLALADGAGRPRTGLVIKNNDQPSLSFFSPDKKVVWAAP